MQKRRWAWMMILVASPAGLVWAKPAPELVAAIQHTFPPAEDGRSFVSSQALLDMDKVRGFAVVKRTGIPAGQAYWFITHQDYEYRPLIITKNSARTYMGKVAIELQAGTIMVVSSTEVFQHTVQIKLLSKDVIPEKGDKPTHHDTRAAVALTFRFPELQMTAADVPTVLARIEEYITPALSLVQAEQIASGMRADK